MTSARNLPRIKQIYQLSHAKFVSICLATCVAELRNASIQVDYCVITIQFFSTLCSRVKMVTPKYNYNKTRRLLSFADDDAIMNASSFESNSTERGGIFSQLSPNKSVGT